jgi:hypothetical protein
MSEVRRGRGTAQHVLTLLLAVAIGWYVLADTPWLRHFALESALLAYILHSLCMPVWAIGMVVFTSFFQTHLFDITSIKYGPDIKGHLDYIYYLMTHSFVPPAPISAEHHSASMIQAIWHRQQPPLYYEWCALAGTLGEWLGVSKEGMIRLASRTLYLGYVIWVMLIVERMRLPFAGHVVVIASILFWPSAQGLSVRTSTDLGFMFFYGAALYHLQRWYENTLPKYFGYACVAAGLALLCKATGVIALTTVGLVAIYAILSRRLPVFWFCDKRLWRSYAITVFCLALYFGRLAYYMWWAGMDIHWFANTHEQNMRVKVPVTWEYMTSFHVGEFISNPGTITAALWAPTNILHTSYWDAFFRTLLCGDDLRVARPLLSLLSFYWCLLFGLSLLQIARCVIHVDVRRQYLVLIVACVVMVGVHMIQRSLVSDRYFAHARYIFPLTMLQVALAGGLLKDLHAKRSDWGYALAVTVCGCFAAMSIVASILHCIDPGLSAIPPRPRALL